MRFCDQCGTQLNENGKYCSACGAPVPLDPPPPQPVCSGCGEPLEDGAAFCCYCGTQQTSVYPAPAPVTDTTPVNAVPTAQATPSHSGPSAPASTDPVLSTTERTVWDTVLSLFCGLLWLFAPFIAINLFTMGDQPTALQYIRDDVIYLGELTESEVFWTAVITMLGIIICLIASICKSFRTVRVTSVICLLSLAWMMGRYLYAFDGDSSVWECFGIGYWGLALLFLIMAIISRSDE